MGGPRGCTCAGPAPGYPQHEDHCGRVFNCPACGEDYADDDPCACFVAELSGGAWHVHDIDALRHYVFPPEDAITPKAATSWASRG